MGEVDELRDYFESAGGTGVLSTSDAAGNVDSALYARPHIQDDGTAAFIMRERLSHANVQANPHACYLFLEDGPGYVGKRLYLTRTREESDTAVIEQMRRRDKPMAEQAEPRSVVYFRIDQVRPLVGG